ncbi:MAG: HAMP domain-containing histidine kinase [Planctomycetes bacterium]|nr:HAMP domain-containing histidine kinase [Planctomycetota bacterium]
MFGRGVSLGDKSLLVFGAVVVVIATLAAGLLWWRVGEVGLHSQMSATRDMARFWAGAHVATEAQRSVTASWSVEEADGASARVRYTPWFEWDARAASDAGGFASEARRKFDTVKPNERAAAEHQAFAKQNGARVFRVAKVVFNGEGQRAGVLEVERTSPDAGSILWIDRVLLGVLAVGAGGLSVLAFYLVTSRIILAPVRQLRETAEAVRGGDLGIRADVHTGDEFEELAEAFNLMLTDLQSQQQAMRGVNKSLDLELTKLAERNLSLFESARLKGEFLARVSHELRTPMNAIIGFAELLQEGASAEREAPARASDPDRIERRQKYLNNILSAGRTLLEMINDLLAMARIEAGNIEVSVQELDVASACEGLGALIKPLADKKSIRLVIQTPGAGGDADAARALVIRTDVKKFEQIVFNFLSNAVKFTPESGAVTLRAEQLHGADGVTRVRVSVLDTGPGIPKDQHAFVFEKFTQIDGSRTREHQGTGLGLAIAKEFAELIQGEIQLVSEAGRGSMFSLIVPTEVDEAEAKRAASRVVGRVRERGRVGAA